MVTTGLGIYVIYELLRHHQAEKSNEVVKPLSALAASWLAQKWWKVRQTVALLPCSSGDASPNRTATLHTLFVSYRWSK